MPQARVARKGGFPVLRLRTLEIAYMAEAQAAAKSGAAASKEKRSGPRSMEEKRADLEKRRLIRAVELLRGSMLGIKVDVGTEKHPEEVSPPEPKVPELLDLVALVLVYGTGFPVGDGAGIPDRPDAETLAAALADVWKASPKNELATRSALWARVREPIARALRIVGTLKAESVADLASQAGTVCSLCGLDWQQAFLKPAATQIPEPRAWRAA